MDQAAKHAWLRQPLEVTAGLAELDPLALDPADSKSLAFEPVEVDAPRRDVATRLGGGELDAVLGRQRFQCLGGDQGELLIAFRLDSRPSESGTRLRARDPRRRALARRALEARPARARR